MLHSEKNKCLYDNKFRDCNNFFVINSNENVVNYFIKSNASKPVGRKTISTLIFLIFTRLFHMINLKAICPHLLIKFLSLKKNRILYLIYLKRKPILLKKLNLIVK